MATDTVTVQGSKGDSYIISVNASTGMAQCSCPSYRYSRTACKHMVQALADLTPAPARHLHLV